MLHSEGTIIKGGAKSRGAWNFLGAKIKALRPSVFLKDNAYIQHKKFHYFFPASHEC